MTAFELNDIGRTFGGRKIVEHFVTGEMSRNFNTMGVDIIPIDKLGSRWSKTKEKAFSGINREIILGTATCRAWRTNPNATTEGVELGKVFTATESKLEW